MGVNWQYVTRMQELGLLGDGGGRILDIGSSNVYLADAAGVASFVRVYNPAAADTDGFAARIAAGSGYDPVRGGLNEAFVGEVFEAAGFGYEAIDIADGYRTTIVDLNHQLLPEPFRNAFDLVLNFGTTEHILNQANSFRAIHQAAKPGGHIWHQLPAIGFLDHGYFCYTGRFFFDLAGYNGYEITEMWFDGPAGPENVYASVRSYQSLYPALARVLGKIGQEARESALDAQAVPTVSINVIYRKMKDNPFMGMVETSTSVGEIPAAVTGSYFAAAPGSTAPSDETSAAAGA